MKIDINQMERNYHRRFKTVPRAAKAGLNAAHGFVIRKLPRRISDITGIKVGDIKKEIFLKRKATVNNLTAIIALRKKNFGLHYFKAFQHEYGVTAFPYKRGTSFKSAFIVKGGGKTAGKVFMRKGRKRLPIIWPAAVRITLNKAVFKDIEYSMNEVFHQAFKKSMDKG